MILLSNYFVLLSTFKYFLLSNKLQVSQLIILIKIGLRIQKMAYFKRDMLSIKTRNLLADYLADLTLLIDSMESFRNGLASLDAFDGISLFRFLDREQKGFLTVHDFQWLLGGKNRKIMHYAFSWFDNSKVGEITRLQFIDYLFPRENEQLRELVSARMQAVSDPFILPPNISEQIDIFKSLLMQIMQKEIRLIGLRHELKKQEDYSIKAVMNSLDGNNHGWIVTEDLYKFMKNYDIDVTEKHMKELLGHYDCDMNGKISMEELTWVIEGFENRDHPYRKIIQHYQKRKNLKQKPKKKLKKQVNSDTKKARMQRGKKKQQVKKNKTEAEEEPHTENYRLMKQSYMLMQQEAKQIDQQLLRYQKQLQNQNKSELQARLQEIKLKKRIKKAQIQRIYLIEREREALLRQQETYLRERIQRQNEFREKGEDERLKSLETELNRALARQASLYNKTCSSLFVVKEEDPLITEEYLNKYYNRYTDRLGIKQHLEMTEKHLEKSKKLRQQIRQERNQEQQLQSQVQKKMLASRKYQFQNQKQDLFATPIQKNAQRYGRIASNTKYSGQTRLWS